MAQRGEPYNSSENTTSENSANPSGASNEGRQSARYNSSPSSAQTPNRNTTANNSPHCTSPAEVFTIANALAVLFASNMTQDELQTLINMLTFLVSGLSTIVTQQQICEGIIVQPPE